MSGSAKWTVYDSVQSGLAFGEDMDTARIMRGITYLLGPSRNDTERSRILSPQIRLRQARTVCVSALTLLIPDSLMRGWLSASTRQGRGICLSRRQREVQ
jgi:hypothetical protein